MNEGQFTPGLSSVTLSASPQDTVSGCRGAAGPVSVGEHSVASENQGANLGIVVFHWWDCSQTKPEPAAACDLRLA